MQTDFWIAIASLVGVMVVFVLFDILSKKLKKIRSSNKEQKIKKRDESKNKKAQKKEAARQLKQQKQEKKQEKTSQQDANPSLNEEISYERRSLKTKIDPNVKPKVEEIDLKGFGQKMEYNSENLGSLSRSVRGNKMQFPRPNFRPNISPKNSIKDQIKRLSPELKAIIFTNALSKKEDWQNNDIGA